MATSPVFCHYFCAVTGLCMWSACLKSWSIFRLSYVVDAGLPSGCDSLFASGRPLPELAGFAVSTVERNGAEVGVSDHHSAAERSGRRRSFRVPVVRNGPESKFWYTQMGAGMQEVGGRLVCSEICCAARGKSGILSSSARSESGSALLEKGAYALVPRPSRTSLFTASFLLGENEVQLLRNPHDKAAAAGDEQRAGTGVAAQPAVRDEENRPRMRQDGARGEKKVELEIKGLAKKKEVTSVRILAKEIVRTRKTRDRMLTAKAQMNSISMQLQQAAMTMKMGEAVAGSTQIMQAMSSLIKLPELTETMEGMAKEMENLGVIEGVMTDTLDAVDDVDIDEATDQEVNKVLEELAVDTIANVPSAAQGALPAGQKVPSGRVKLSAQQASEEAELERRLNAL
ncbi:Charged multivesicular body protein 3 [Perkinsus olseni]|uniref:Charged multivesicular body protein 3 n=1 Tax=Perkinsus olseni TaxID=32597 RepID=A0A7J6NJJ6_PEROL|nr:Charged multivesicular body protein 3 [Perkinsus olseni]